MTAGRPPPSTVITGEVIHNERRSSNFVSEFMVLMSECVGDLCVALKAPVWFKVQEPKTPLGPAELGLLEDETPFLRSNRIVRRLRAAVDSKAPGRRQTVPQFLMLRLREIIAHENPQRDHFIRTFLILSWISILHLTLTTSLPFFFFTFSPPPYSQATTSHRAPQRMCSVPPPSDGTQTWSTTTISRQL